MSPEGERPFRRVSPRDRVVRFAKWRLGNIAGLMLVASVVCCVLGPVLVVYGLASGHFDVVLASLGMTLLGVATFFVGPAVILELILSRGKPAWRE